MKRIVTTPTIMLPIPRPIDNRRVEKAKEAQMNAASVGMDLSNASCILADICVYAGIGTFK